jgi:hypothetical protein
LIKWLQNIHIKSKGESKMSIRVKIVKASEDAWYNRHLNEIMEVNEITVVGKKFYVNVRNNHTINIEDCQVLKDEEFIDQELIQLVLDNDELSYGAVIANYLICVMGQREFIKMLAYRMENIDFNTHITLMEILKRKDF